jgi:hypothetical protein
MCYQLNMRPANHSSAEQWCDSQGGLLWWPRNASEELAVNRWFGLLNNNHAVWLGIARGGASGLGSNWTAADGETHVNMYPNTGSLSSYAHWGGDHFQSGGPFYQSSQMCTLGQTWTLAYDSYTCGTGSTSLANYNCYSGRTSVDRKLAWRAIPCSVSAKYLCALPAYLMPCAPPPPPPPPPPPGPPPPPPEV